MKPILWLAIIPFIMLLSGSCGERRGLDRENLERIEKGMSSDPKASLLALDSIDRESLENPDQMLYDLLRIKASDKARKHHTNEKPILRVVDYYVRTGNNERQAESLYFAGRVFSDLGDYSSAIQYFQQALNHIQNETDDPNQLELKTRILYHLGNLLQSIRMYDQALDYLEEGQRLLEQSADSLRLMYNLELQGSVHLHAGNLVTARNVLNQSLGIASNYSSKDVALQQMYLAGVFYKEDKYHHALNTIREIPHRVPVSDYATALGYASDIYLANDIKDTAYMYAHILCGLDCTNNQKHGFQNILETDLIQYLPKDSIIEYVRKYSKIMEHFVDKNADEAALIQSSYYNYKIQEKGKLNAEQKIIKQDWFIGGISFVVLVLIIVILYLYLRLKRTELTIQKVVNGILIGETKSDNDNVQNPVDGDNEIVSAHDVCVSLRQKLSEDLIKNGGEISPSSQILSSETHRTAEEIAASKKNIPDNSPLWESMEKEILSLSPNFKNSLTILTVGKLKPAQYRLVLLIRLGMTPKQCALLLSKEQSTITYQRKQLSIRIMGSEEEYGNLDSIIRLL